MNYSFVGEQGPEILPEFLTDGLRFGVFTESLHPRASGKFAKKGSAAPAKKTAGSGSKNSSGSKGSLSFDGKRGAGYGTPGGDKRVHALQQALNRLGFGDGSGAKLKDDGKLGPKTTAAIKRAQRALGLKPDGVVSPGLLAKLTKAKSAKYLKAAPAKKAAKPKKAPAPFVKSKSTAAPARKAAPVSIHAGR